MASVSIQSVMAMIAYTLNSSHVKLGQFTNWHTKILLCFMCNSDTLKMVSRCRQPNMTIDDSALVEINMWGDLGAFRDASNFLPCLLQT